MQGIYRLFAMLVIAAYFAAPRTAAAGPTFVFDAKSGTVLHAENAHDLWYPASLTKLMTAYVTFKAVRGGRLTMDSPVAISSQALAQPPSKVGFPVGSRLTLSDALHLLIVKSANDIAVAVAETVSGSEHNFVNEMNATSRALGMTRTQFVNPHGLPAPDQVTMARDMGILSRAIVQEFPEHAALFEVPAVFVGKRRLSSHNHLLGRYNGADGMKTGFICASGFNLVASATQSGWRLVAVVLGQTSAIQRKEEAEKLLEAGFRKALIGISGRSVDNYLPGPAASMNPTNMRPMVCGPNRVPRPDRQLNAADHRLSPVRVALLPADGTVAASNVPSPVPRPDDAPGAALFTAGAAAAPALRPSTAAVDAGDVGSEQDIVPLPVPRPKRASGQ